MGLKPGFPESLRHYVRGEKYGWHFGQPYPDVLDNVRRE
jgi:hypothetical protein